MKKKLHKILCLSLVIISISACSEDSIEYDNNIEIVTEDCENSNYICKNEKFETSTKSIEIFPNTEHNDIIEDDLIKQEWSQYKPSDDKTSDNYYEIDTNKFKIIDDYDIEFSLTSLLNEAPYDVENCYGFAKIADLFILDINDANSAQLLLVSNNNYAVINDLSYIGVPYYFVYDNTLCIYDCFLSNGTVHICYYEYSIDNGVKLGEYIELYDIGNPSKPYKVISHGFDFESFTDVEKHMLELSDVLYDLEFF